MNLIRCLHINGFKEAVHQIEKVGVDPTGIELMKGKTLHFNLKVEGIDPRTANILKQEMLSLGGDAALDGRGLDCSALSTDGLLMGSQRQFEKLIQKLESYPHLQKIGQALGETLQNILKTQFILRCRRRTFRLGERTFLMGVLNITPDSFSDGGLFFDKEKAIAHGLKMAEEGADIIDIGGESTRPGSKPLGLEEELRRVLPVIETLSRETEVPISIDTYKSEVARRAIDAGAEIINDISGLHLDPELARVAAKEQTPIVLMHIRGTPETMQKDIRYDSLFSEIIEYLKEGIRRAESAGVDSAQIVIDPGIGFGKTLGDNLLIIKRLSEFRILGKPILLGTSRKSFIGKILDTNADQRLEGTLSSIAIGVLNGAHIIRSHDVLQAKRAIAVADAIRMAEG
ncbi:MAG: dihydropteroate synthase [Deltaproteobacteria bacterium RBG_16_49_23]|nr:MAG: dihydropteroate synthase [Deltaproteobacteria bacterium RBG_16_49_23]